MVDRPKTAWVIGSGFSRALGGPLLNNLLSLSALEDCQEVFPKLPDRRAVYEIYRNLKGTRWEHAEQFLEFIDLATDARSPNHNILKRQIEAARINDWANTTPELFRDLTTLSIATEVSTYTESVDLRAEAWAPYIRWAGDRRENDAIITFNYDTVIESLGRADGVKHFSRDTVFLPLGQNTFAADQCVIYKLHGSADWAWDENYPRERFKRFGSVGGFDLTDSYRPLIAMPGATKKRLCGEHLDYIWKTAMTQLREAEVVVFLGYRFPPSDAFARTTLLNALQQNENPYLRVHTVLGPDVGGEASRRLQSLLTQVLEAAGRTAKPDPAFRPRTTEGNGRFYNVVQQPLYVEDYLSVLSLDGLYGKRTGTEPIKWT
jgi:hypothetical protein